MPIRCDYLQKLPGIQHGFFTREGGKSSGLYASLNCGYGSGDDIDSVTANRDIVAAEFGSNASQLCTAYQIHSAEVAVLDKPWDWKDAPQVDALVTATPGILLGILTADCLPILFADPKNRVIGAAHAGWKGAISGVIEATVKHMCALGAEANAIHATIGPAIAQPSYEVGAEFLQRFLDHSPAHQCYFVPSSRADHFLFDLKSYASDRLRVAGLSQINILAHDTCLDENRFFSYRRSCLRSEGAYGRLISVISIKG
ncbi:MAG: peptidoglycan editing factor PgeF [Rickettsiales bacterium]|nr:peptidoglycan editing factor PgeF [Rickettsiales bacterium]